MRLVIDNTVPETTRVHARSLRSAFPRDFAESALGIDGDPEAPRVVFRGAMKPPRRLPKPPAIQASPPWWQRALNLFKRNS